MAEDVNDGSWLLELEVALLDDCDFQTVERICQGRILSDALRPETWQVCLDVKDLTSTLDPWTEIYDLPEQNLIRKDVQELVERLGNEEEDKVSVVSDMESIITTYSKAVNEPYKSDNGWLDILQHLITLKLPGQQLYNIFARIMSRYIPRTDNKNVTPAHIFRLLLLYHEPELCSFLDTKKITADAYASSWFKTWFAAQCDLKVTLALWDICLQRSNPFYIFYLALVLLVNLKENILMMKDEKKSDIVDLLVSAPCSLEFNDVEDFCSLAIHYAVHTPNSFSTDYCALLANNREVNENENLSDLSQALCLPVSAQEVINKQGRDKAEGVQYFVVDCRPADQYNNGHLPTAFHLDASLMLQDPNAYMTAVQALFAAQKQAIDADSVAGGEHLCFVGSGREEEDQYIHMVIASFLQKHLKYISIVIDGYLALHEELIDDLDNKMADHSSKCCIICNPDAASSTTDGTDSDDLNFIDKGNNLFGKLSSAMRSKSVEVKTKLVEYITNPVAGTPVDRHVSSTDKLGKRYRNVASVFSIGEDPEDDDNYELSDDEAAEIINISIWLKKPDVINSFKCHEVKKTGYMYASHLLVTYTHIFVLRELEDRKGFAQITGRRPLSTVVKITSKRKHPELITFKYGYINGEDGIEITDIDRFLIPNAGEATKLIKQQIVQQMNKEGKS